MKKILFFVTVCLLCATTVIAQDDRYVGTWKWHYDSPYDDEIEGPHSRDEFIRIDIEDGMVFVRTKLESKNFKGIPFQNRYEGENVVVNTDGSISFDVFLCKKEYEDSDRLYWTVWYHYTIKYEGGRLLCSERLEGLGYDSYGHIVEDHTELNRATQKTYYNEKDNW